MAVNNDQPGMPWGQAKFIVRKLAVGDTVEVDARFQRSVHNAAARESMRLQSVKRSRTSDGRFTYTMKRVE